MGAAVGTFAILLIDDDDLLAMDAAALSHPGVIIEVAASVDAARKLKRGRNFDGVCVNLALDGAMRFIAEAASSGFQMTPILALAAHGVDGDTLEYTLTLAELRGASASAPKPIDASDLVCATLDMAASQGEERPALRALIREIEGPLGC